MFTTLGMIYMTTCALLLLAGDVVLANPKITKFDVPRHVAYGSNVTFTCEYELPKDDTFLDMSWLHNNKEFLRIDRNYNKKLFTQTELNVDVERSDKFNVHVTNISRSSNGTITCIVKSKPGFQKDEQTKEIDVLVIPDDPPEIEGTVDSHAPGDLISLNCSSAPSVPAASMEWTINDKPVRDEYLIHYEPEMTEDELYISKLGISFELKSEHFNQRVVKFKCKSSIETLYKKTDKLSHTHVPAAVEQKEASTSSGCVNSMNLISAVLLLLWTKVW